LGEREKKIESKKKPVGEGVGEKKKQSSKHREKKEGKRGKGMQPEDGKKGYVKSPLPRGGNEGGGGGEPR